MDLRTIIPPLERYELPKRSFYKSNFNKCRFCERGGRNQDSDHVPAWLELCDRILDKLEEGFMGWTEVSVVDSGKGICEHSVHVAPIEELISLEHLLQNSEEHKYLFFKAFEDIKVPHQITAEELARCLRSINWSPTTIGFTDWDLPPGRDWHNDELRITVGCRGKLISDALVDNGAGLNIMTLKTARKLGIQDEHISPDSFPVSGYNGSIEYAKGFVDCQVSVGNVSVSPVRFYVMDIKSNHNLILGRPFIHSLGAVPSTWHQKLRFPFGGAVVTVDGERYY